MYNQDSTKNLAAKVCLPVEKLVLHGIKVAVKCYTKYQFDQVTGILGYDWINPEAIDLDMTDCIGITVKSREKESWYIDQGYYIIDAVDFIKQNI